jgi:hypothetical protein
MRRQDAPRAALPVPGGAWPAAVSDMASCSRPIPSGKVWRRKRRMNSVASSVITLVTPSEDHHMHQHRGRWSAEDWRVLFHERAGVAEFDGGLSCSEAEAHAFECCVVD